MPKYKVLKKSYINDRIVEEDEVVTLNEGIEEGDAKFITPGKHLVQVGDDAYFNPQNAQQPVLGPHSADPRGDDTPAVEEEKNVDLAKANAEVAQQQAESLEKSAQALQKVNAPVRKH